MSERFFAAVMRYVRLVQTGNAPAVVPSPTPTSPATGPMVGHVDTRHARVWFRPGADHLALRDWCCVVTANGQPVAAVETSEWLSLRTPGQEHSKRREVWLWWQAVHAAAPEFGPECSIDRGSEQVGLAEPSWYVAHMSGCLVSYAARLGLPTVNEALGAFDEQAREHWAERAWTDEYAKRRIGLGRTSDREDGDDAPF